MPLALKRPCRWKGCKELSNTGYCDTHRKDKQKVKHKLYDSRRGSANERGYTYRWQKLRELFLKANPLCAFCLKVGQITAARVVDHIIPHRGDPALLYDENNLQSLCDLCHNSIKAGLEAGEGG